MSELPQLSGERFELVSKLGEGGMASVYRAVDRDTREWVAVKVLHPRYVEKGKIRKRFATEAQAMMRLKHRNVIHVIDVRTDAAQPFLVMEIAEGGCVVEWLAEHGPMPPRMAVDVAIQVCKGLGAAHRQGVIHRDVKPHNILVTRRGVCKITDFGIARLDDEAASLTRTGSVMGTLGYIAPEQRASAKDVDERTDIYSVGATLYTMLTARTTMDLFFADQEPEMMAGIPDVLRPIVMKATRYRREDRHPSMRDLAKELYHVKGLLPEDPPRTPSLVMRGVEEHSDELDRLQTGDSSDPLGGLSLDSVTPSTAPVPAPPVDEFSLSTTPGIPRADLLRTAETPQQREVARSVSRAAFAAAAVGLFGAVALLMVGIDGRTRLAQQEAILQGERARLEQVLEAEAPLTEELRGLGAASNDELAVWPRDTAAISLRLTAASMALAAHRVEPGSSKVHLSRSAAERIDRITLAVQRVDREQRQMGQVADGLTARVALTLGLAPDPR